MRLLFLAFVLLEALVVSGPHTALQENTPTAVAAGPTIVISKLVKPIYPAIARAARISGEVEVRLAIAKDGTVISAVVLSGPPMLQEAAIKSAQESHFDCRRCVAETNSYGLVYSFEFSTQMLPPVSRQQETLHVIQSGNHITVVAQPSQLHIYFANVQARSARCLYLWRCGYRWGGEDFYFYRTRSPKCLYLWKCGHRRRADN